MQPLCRRRLTNYRRPGPGDAVTDLAGRTWYYLNEDAGR